MFDFVCVCSPFSFEPIREFSACFGALAISVDQSDDDRFLWIIIASDDHFDEPFL